jgi:antitoxin component YwqK of YwqJK toxin-antitoxin module
MTKFYYQFHYADGTPCKCDYMERIYYYPSKTHVFSETPYVRGARHGIAREYYESGVLKKTTSYVEGLKEGLDVLYDEITSLAVITPYKNNVIHGIEKYYSPIGKCRYEKVFAHGKFMCQPSYDTLLVSLCLRCPMENLL